MKCNPRRTLLAWLLTAAMLLSLLPTVALAADTVNSGTCGDNLTWTLDEADVLTISGTGDMYDYGGSSPWDSFSITSAVIEDGVTSIGSYAFSGCTDLTSVTIGSGVISIGEWAFYHCTGLTSIAIPESVTGIGASAFWACTGLTSVTIPDSVTSIGGSAFSSCTSLTSIVIPDSVTYIGWWAFEYCTGLTSVTIGNSVTSIGSYAFFDTALTSVTIPSSVTDIGSQAFCNCTSLTEIQVSEDNTDYCSVDGVLFTKDMAQLVCFPAGKAVAYTIPDSISAIGSYTFYACANLTGITIPDSVTSIGGSAFFSCTSLTSIVIPDSVTSIDYDAFQNCTSLTSVAIPSSVTDIGSSAFEGCTSLTEIQVSADNADYCSVDGVLFTKDMTRLICFPAGKTGAYTIPDSVTGIDWPAFQNCTGLTGITIGSGLTGIDSYRFSGCTGLTSITIPDSVTSIGNCAFLGCTSLTNVTIPSSVTGIDNYAFYGCSSLAEFVVNSENTAFCAVDGVLYSKDQSELILYPAGKTNTSYTVGSGVTTIAYGAFASASQLVSVSMPDSVTSIDTSAFAECGLSNVAIPASVSSIGAQAFINTGLTDVYYGGDETGWSAISISYGNTDLTNAAIHYNSTGDGSTETGAASFNDVQDTSQYYYDAVYWAYDNGITTGTSDTLFSPSDSCTRAQFVTFLWRLAGEPAPTAASCSFTDLDTGEYYYRAVLWAVEQGVTNGTSATAFSPNDKISRAQAVTMLYRYAGSPSVSGLSTSFNDVPSGEYYYNAVLWAVKSGITNGTSATKFSPDDTCDRAMMVTYLYRYAVEPLTTA